MVKKVLLIASVLIVFVHAETERAKENYADFSNAQFPIEQSHKKINNEVGRLEQLMRLCDSLPADYQDKQRCEEFVKKIETMFDPLPGVKALLERELKQAQTEFARDQIEQKLALVNLLLGIVTHYQKIESSGILKKDFFAGVSLASLGSLVLWGISKYY